MRPVAITTALVLSLLTAGRGVTRADTPAPACRHHQMSTPGYTLPPSRFDPPTALSEAERSALDGAWVSCDGAQFVRGGTCAGAVRERWDVDGGLCERSLGARGRRELAFCHATRVGPGLVDLALVPEDGGAVVHLTGTARRLVRR